jgi:TatD family-associated radical SAM protein
LKDLVLSYNIGDSLYLNITNRCTCNCVFCIRKNGKGIGYNLWLEKEPTVSEVINSLDNLPRYKEVVFCGYGEPLIRLDLVKEVSAYIKGKNDLPIRINTNGHADLIYGAGSIYQLKGLVDRISISLNAQDSQKYQELCSPVFGPKSYEAVINFAKSCIGIIPDITLSVVEWPGVDIRKCQNIAEKLGLKFRLRHYSK